MNEIAKTVCEQSTFTFWFMKGFAEVASYLVFVLVIAFLIGSIFVASIVYDFFKARIK